MQQDVVKSLQSDRESLTEKLYLLIISIIITIITIIVIQVIQG